MKDIRYVLLGIGIVAVVIGMYARSLSIGESLNDIENDSSVQFYSNENDISDDDFDDDSFDNDSFDDENNEDFSEENMVNSENYDVANDDTSDTAINIANLQEESVVNALLTKDAIMGAVSKLAVAGCSNYESHQAYLLKAPVMSSPREGTWQERWGVSGCGNKYQIDFEIKFLRK